MYETYGVRGVRIRKKWVRGRCCERAFGVVSGRTVVAFVRTELRESLHTTELQQVQIVRVQRASRSSLFMIRALVNTRDKSVLPLCLAKTGPLFHVVAFWSRFRKFCFRSKNYLCAFPIFGMSCVKRRQTHVFIILTARSFRKNSPFALTSQCRRLNL